jgi:probable HAF family extracellular repeat protein
MPTAKGLLCLAVVIFTTAVALAAKPAPPAPAPPLYTLRMLENEFFAGGWSWATRLNNLGDTMGVAQINNTGQSQAAQSTGYVSTPEGRAVGVDMVDLKVLATDLFTPTEEAAYSGLSFSDINDSRQIVGSARVFNGVSNDYHLLVYQLAVSAGGLHELSSFTDLGIHGGAVAINNSGDILTGSGELYIADLGWGTLPLTLTGIEMLSDRDGLNRAYAVGTATTGWRATIDMATGTVTSTINLQGPYFKDRSTWARGVNSAGLVVGEMVTGRSDQRAYVYENGILKNLGNLTSDNEWNDSYANSVNSTGDVVGGSFTGLPVPSNSGLLYVKSKNATYDSAATLNAADRAIYTSLMHRDSSEINDSGLICGPLGAQPVSNATNRRAYLLEPFVP